MKKTAFLAQSTLLLCIGCGTWIGNPGEGDDEGEEAFLAIPTISFTLPTPVSALLTANSDDLLTGWVERINDNVTKLNEDIAKTNNDYEFDGPQTVTGRGPDQNESGSFSNLSDGTYDYQVVVCVGDAVATVTKWSKDGRYISSERDLNHKPDKPEDLRVKTVYSENTEKSLTITFYGEPAGAPSDVDETLLASWDEAIQTSAEDFTIRGVRDWFNSGETLTADDYLTGKLQADGTGEFVGWSNRAVNTCGEFPELTESAPSLQWCNSREIGSDAWYSQDEAAEAWDERLIDIGVAPESNLGDFEINATCP